MRVIRVPTSQRSCEDKEDNTDKILILMPGKQGVLNKYWLLLQPLVLSCGPMGAARQDAAFSVQKAQLP